MSALIKEIDARDLVGRLAINTHGAEFIITKITFDAQSGSVLIWVSPIDELDPDTIDAKTGRVMGESGLLNLDGWEIHQKLADL